MPDFAPNDLFDAPERLAAAPQFKPNPLFDDPVGYFVEQSAREGKDFGEVKPVLEQAGMDPAKMEGRYKIDARRGYEAKRQETAQEFLSKRIFPFASGVGNAAQEARYKRVLDQVNAGSVPSDDDTEFAARHEHLKQFKEERQQTLPGQLAEAVAGMPALMGEAMVTRLPGMGLGKGLLANTARSAAQAPLMPSLYAEQAAENATRKGGDVTDFKNLAPPLAMAALQNVVLGRLQGRAATSTVPTAAGRLAYAGALGVGEQAGVDAAAGAVDEFLPDSLKTETKYGVLGDLARGQGGKATTHATVQALTFAAFAAAHGRSPKPIVDKAAAAFDALHAAGVPESSAGPVLADAVERVQTAPDKAAAETALESLPDGPLKDYVREAVLPTLTTEKRTEDTGPPEGTDERRGMHLRAAAADAAAKFVDAGHGPAVLVDMDVNNMKGFDAHAGTEAARRHVDAMVEIVRSELEAAGGKAEAFRHAGDAQGDEHSAVVLGLDKAAANAALARAQAKLDAYARANGFAELPHAKGGDRLPGAGLTTFAEPFVKGRGWKETATEAEAGTETLKQRRIRPPEAPPEPVTVTDSPQPEQPQRPPLRIADLTFGQTKVAAMAAGLPHLGPVDALKRSLVKALGENLPDRLRTAVEAPPPDAIKRILPKAPDQGLRTVGEPGLGASPGQPGPRLVENVNPGVARMRARQAKLEAHGLVPTAKAQLEASPKLSPNQKRAKTWALLKRAEFQAEAVRERAGRDAADAPEFRVPDAPAKVDPNAWKMNVLRNRLLSGRQLISDAMTDPTPEKVAAALGAVESIRRATEANGEAGRSLRDKAFPGWAEVEKRFAPKSALAPKGPKAAILDAVAGKKAGDVVTIAELRKALPGLSEHAQNEAILDAVFRAPGARDRFRLVDSSFTGNERDRQAVRDAEPIVLKGPHRDDVFSHVELKADAAPKAEPVKVTGKLKPKLKERTPEEVAAGKAKRIANLKQNKTALSLEGLIRKWGGINPDSWGSLGLDMANVREGNFKNVFRDGRKGREGNKGVLNLEDLLPRLIDYGQIVPDERFHPHDQLLDLLSKKTAAAEGLESNAGRQQIENAINDHYRNEHLREFHDQLKKDNPTWSDADLERASAELLAEAEKRGWADAADGAEADAGRAADGADGGDQLREAGGRAGAERGGRPEVPDPADDAAAPAAEGGLDLSFDFGHNAEGAAERLLAEHVRTNAEPALPEAMGAASRGFTARLSPQAGLVKEAAVRLVHRVQDFAGKLGGRVAPALTRMSEAAGSAVARLGAARMYARELAPFLLDRVMGDKVTTADRLLFGSVFAERRLRHMRNHFLAEARAASNEGLRLVKAGDKKGAAVAFERASKMGQAGRDVISLVGRSFADPSIPYPIPDEAAYQRALADPRVREQFARHGKEVVPSLEKYFRLAEGIEETDPIHGPTQLPGLAYTLVGRPESDTTPTTVVLGRSSRGNMIGQRQGKLGAARAATGAAEHGYELDYGLAVEKMLADRVPKGAKADLYRTLVDEGLGVWRKPKEPAYEPEGVPWRVIPKVEPPPGTQAAARGETELHVHPDAYGDLRQVLGTDQPVGRLPLAGALTVAAIASTAEVTYHTRNLLTILSRPGLNPLDVFRGVRSQLHADPQFKAEVVELARIGAMKEHGFENFHFLSKVNPLTYGGRVLTVLDRATRVAAAKAYDRMVAAGRAEGSEGGKRDFINQLGNYQKLTQNRAVAMLRDSGIGPFATAGSNFWAMGLRAITLQHGVRTTSRAADYRLKAEMLVRMAAVPAATALLNFLVWGKVDGDENTPLGALKVSSRGGKTTYLDLTALTGVTRGLRETGLLALAEASRPGAKARGATAGDAFDRSVKDVITSLTHPAIGPPAAFVETAVTGEDSRGIRVAPHADLKTGESQKLLNLYAAVWQANPVLDSWLRPEVDRRLGLKPGRPEDSAAEKASKLLGPYGPMTRGTPPGQPQRREETPRPTREQRLLRPGK